MEGEREAAEEKEDEEEEEEEDGHHGNMLAASSVDQQDFPIMHWEDLSRRISELERQEQERTERVTEGGQRSKWREFWEEEEDLRRFRLITSRFQNHRNLQLCFINDSDSEDEEESKTKGRDGCHGAGLKQEVVAALRKLRDELLEEQKEKEHLSSSSSCVVKRKHLERLDLQQRSVQQLISLKTSLEHDIHALSSELVAHLLVRDQLRTKQDAMLLDVQDLT
ncbi:schwannomin-interacting protein 1 isoform 1-T2 [Pholidichthys leucotaenia]